MIYNIPTVNVTLVSMFEWGEHHIHVLCMLPNPTPLYLVKSMPVVSLICVQSYQMGLTCEETYQSKDLNIFLVCHSFH